MPNGVRRELRAERRRGRRRASGAALGRARRTPWWPASSAGSAPGTASSACSRRAASPGLARGGHPPGARRRRPGAAGAASSEARARARRPRRPLRHRAARGDRGGARRLRRRGAAGGHPLRLPDEDPRVHGGRAGDRRPRLGQRARAADPRRDRLLCPGGPEPVRRGPRRGASCALRATPALRARLARPPRAASSSAAGCWEENARRVEELVAARGRAPLPVTPRRLRGARRSDGRAERLFRRRRGLLPGRRLRAGHPARALGPLRAPRRGQHPAPARSLRAARRRAAPSSCSAGWPSAGRAWCATSAPPGTSSAPTARTTAGSPP